MGEGIGNLSEIAIIFKILGRKCTFKGLYFDIFTDHLTAFFGYFTNLCMESQVCHLALLALHLS